MSRFFAGLAPQRSAVLIETSAGVRVQGPGSPPQPGFACCEHGIAQMQALFADPSVIPALKDLHAEVAVPVADFAPERAAIVHLLNEQGIPVIAWIELAKQDGIYMNADNVPKAAARVNEFEQWTATNRLHWAAVGLDIEPNFNELAELKTHRWQMFTTLLRRDIDANRLVRAKQDYSAIIANLQSRGYAVQTYLMPYVPAERSAHSTVLDRLLGTVDVRANEEYLMLYTSFARQVGVGMVWSLGRDAEGIAVGSTDGDTPAGSGSGPLDWNEFSRDLIVASHYTKHVGIYDLEGCVQQGFLPSLEQMDWSKSVVIPEASIQRAQRMGHMIRFALWVASHIVYIMVFALMLLIYLVWKWRRRRVHWASTSVA